MGCNHGAQPNAHWRRRFAEVHDKATRPMHVSVVTESALIRGVVTAMNWLVRPRSNYSLVAFDGVDASSNKLPFVHGMKKETLRALLAAAQDAMRKREAAMPATGKRRPWERSRENRSR